MMVESPVSKDPALVGGVGVGAARLSLDNLAAHNAATSPPSRAPLLPAKKIRAVHGGGGPAEDVENQISNNNNNSNNRSIVAPTTEKAQRGNSQRQALATDFDDSNVQNSNWEKSSASIAVGTTSTSGPGDIQQVQSCEDPPQQHHGGSPSSGLQSSSRLPPVTIAKGHNANKQSGSAASACSGTQGSSMASGDGGHGGSSRGGASHPSAFLVPRNPRDTAPGGAHASSPKRRSINAAKGFSSAGSEGAAQLEPALTKALASSSSSIRSSRSVPSSVAGGTKQIKNQLQQTQRRVQKQQGGGGGIVHRTVDPDQEEQAMFEQRLCEDAFGVAVRKINQSGKSQLRYVRCVPLAGAGNSDDAPPPVSVRGKGSSASVSSRHSEGGVVGGQQTPASPSVSSRRAGREGKSSNASLASHGSRSVSSLMGRISRSGRRQSEKGRRRERSRSRERGYQIVSAGAGVVCDKGAGAVGVSTGNGGSYLELSAETQNTNLLSGALTKRNRALTWGKKNEVRLSLDRFVSVRKGKTTYRTRKNACPPERLLSIITDHKDHGSLDIEAPTKLDRDKFARAFARFLGVPLETDAVGGGGSLNGAVTVDFTAENTPAESKQRKGLRSRSRSLTRSGRKGRMSSAHSAPDTSVMRSPQSGSSISSRDSIGQRSASQMASPVGAAEVGILPPISPSSAGTGEDLKFAFGPEGPAGTNLLPPTLTEGGADDVRRENEVASSRANAAHTTLDMLSGVALNAAATPSNNKDTVGHHDRLIVNGPPDVERVHHDAAKQLQQPQAGGTSLQGMSQNVASNVASSTSKPSTQAVSPSIQPEEAKGKEDADDEEDCSDVSSLTAGFDQEIVEELHQALTELRAELDASRAEAARAVKVAEQAIQSAESCSSKDWNSTVTHKAAEAAAQAQKRSAEAMARQRLAEERLAGERRSAAFWRRQAEAAEEEAGALQTRAAAAEVQRAAMAEQLESERRKTSLYILSLKQNFHGSETLQRDALDLAMERNRSLKIELDGTRRDLAIKGEETKALMETVVEIKMSSSDHSKSTSRRKLGFGRKKKGNNVEQPGRSASSARDRSASTLLLGVDSPSSCSGLTFEGQQTGLKESESKDGLTSCPSSDLNNSELILKVHAQAAAMRKQFELLRRATVDEFRSLPKAATEWADQASMALMSSQTEIYRLRDKLALESATRRKLLHEVQDLRGTVRVYCRPRPQTTMMTSSSPKVANGSVSSAAGIVTVPSHETLLLHRERIVSAAASEDGAAAHQNVSNTTPMSFEFDRVFSPETPQNELYTELEELVLGVLDGYNVCIMAYGQSGSGKTHTILGDYSISPLDSGDGDVLKASINNYGIHLQAMEQLFTVAERRNERYQDSFSLTVVEVHNERLCDLIAGTDVAEVRGRLMQGGEPVKGASKGNKIRRQGVSEKDNAFSAGSSFSQPGTGNSTSSKGSKPSKLEIRTNYDGDTVVQGIISIPVNSFEDVIGVWEECLSRRAARLAEQGVENVTEYESKSHVMATINVVSTNIATGVGTLGKIQFVDLAASDLVPRRKASSRESKSSRSSPSDGLLAGVGNNNEWKFANKSLATLSDVVNARCQFVRSVPYRNSTITHLLRDSLEADAKVLLVVCVSSDAKDLQETASALRFASRMRRVTIGKATKHVVSLA